MVLLLILRWICCGRRRGPRLSQEQKVKKWFRLVGLLSVREYGTKFVSRLFYAFLVADSLTSMKSIWTDFREFSDCNNNYTSQLAGNISRQYSKAAEQIAGAVMERSRCMTRTVDVKGLGLDLQVGKIAGAGLKGVFSWFSPQSHIIPDANLTLQTNTDKVMREVADDLSFVTKVAFWVRLIGFIMGFVAVATIVLKATYYTVEDKSWKPGAVGLVMRLVEILQVVAAYVVFVGAVELQSYLTDKACRVNVNNTVITTPQCHVAPEDCDFICENFTQNYSSPCQECNIQYDKWWTEYGSWTNILAVLYFFFLILVIVVELMEARHQKKLAKMVALREKEEKEREKQLLREEKLAKKKRAKRKEKKKAEAAAAAKEDREQLLDEEHHDTRIDIDFYPSEPEARKRKSKSKRKISKSRTKDFTEISDDQADLEYVVDSSNAPSSSYKL